MTRSRVLSTSGAKEYLVLLALTMATIALSVDTIMPGLNAIETEFALTNPNDSQWTIGAVFLGVSLGQIPFGIWSDFAGRRIPIIAGLIGLFVASIIAYLAPSFEILIAARFIQGLAGAGPRALVVSVIRDLYQGADMARMLSLVFMIFISVPLIAPLIGQLIFESFGWRSIFLFLAICFALNALWVLLRLEESLAREHRRPLGLRHAARALRSVFTSKQIMCFLGSVSVILSAFTAYLLSAQPILQDLYQTGEHFPYYFAAIAFSFGWANWSNAYLVRYFALRKLIHLSYYALIVLSLLMLLITLGYHGKPPLTLFAIWAFISFVPVAILFANLNSLAMEPLGHIAGMGSAVIGTVSGVISALFGAWIGALYNDSIYPLILGFCVASLVGLWFVIREERA